MPTEVRVGARGREFTSYGEHAEGDPWDPALRMSDEALAAKFRELAGAAFDARVEPLIAATLALDECGDVRTYVAQLAG
jgi:hypothetical protein